MNHIQPVSRDLPPSDRSRQIQLRVNTGYPNHVLLTGLELAVRHVEQMEIEHDLAAYAEDELAETKWREQGEFDSQIDDSHDGLFA